MNLFFHWNIVRKLCFQVFGIIIGHHLCCSNVGCMLLIVQPFYRLCIMHLSAMYTRVCLVFIATHYYCRSVHISHVKWEITEMPLLYAAATASHQMQVYIVGSLQFSKCLCGKWIVLFMRRRLSHYICGVLQCDVEFLWEYLSVCRKEVETQYLSGCVCVFSVAIYNITFRDQRRKLIYMS